MSCIENGAESSEALFIKETWCSLRVLAEAKYNPSPVWCCNVVRSWERQWRAGVATVPEVQGWTGSE